VLPHHQSHQQQQIHFPSIKSNALPSSLKGSNPKHQSTHEERRRFVPAGGMSGKYPAFVFIIVLHSLRSHSSSSIFQIFPPTRFVILSSQITKAEPLSFNFVVVLVYSWEFSRYSAEHCGSSKFSDEVLGM
jgi:hypothetical protein